MLGDPVRRGPIESISRLAVSITLELRNPSCRIRVTMSRSTRSSAGRTGGATTQNGSKNLAQKKPPSGCFGEQATTPHATIKRGLTEGEGERLQPGRAFLGEEQGKGEAGGGVHPLLQRPEPRRGPHGVDPLGSVLVGALRPDPLAVRKPGDEVRPGDRDLLLP